LERNKALDTLVNELAYGVADAVQDYVAIVMSNSVYPESFPVEHDFEFDPESAELRLIVKVPHPDRFPTTASFKYVKASDSITPVALTAKELRERYCSAIYQVALRSFHEVFEADRRGLIGTVALEVGVQAISPATGSETWIPFVIASAEREAFMRLQLGAVTPLATLEHLGAGLSRNPVLLTPVARKGIRRA
jgi:restriction system protein